MEKSFNDYKKEIEEQLILHAPYLYSGDVTSSFDSCHTKIIANDEIDFNFLIESLEEIYKESYYLLKSKKPKREIVIKNDVIKTIHKIENEILNFKKYLFYSNNSARYLKNSAGIYNSPNFFPYYFIQTGDDQYYNPYINYEEDKNDSIMYVVNGGIQSLVYGIQNMSYEIESYKYTWKHNISYKIYDCDYDVYKIIIRDAQGHREDILKNLV